MLVSTISFTLASWLAAGLLLLDAGFVAYSDYEGSIEKTDSDYEQNKERDEDAQYEPPLTCVRLLFHLVYCFMLLLYSCTRMLSCMRPSNFSRINTQQSCLGMLTI